MLLNHIKLGLRNIQRQTGYTLINIVSLTIGLISIIFIAFWLQEELGYDQFHQFISCSFGKPGDRNWDLLHEMSLFKEKLSANPNIVSVSAASTSPQKALRYE